MVKVLYSTVTIITKPVSFVELFEDNGVGLVKVNPDNPIKRPSAVGVTRHTFINNRRKQLISRGLLLPGERQPPVPHMAVYPKAIRKPRRLKYKTDEERHQARLDGLQSPDRKSKHKAYMDAYNKSPKKVAANKRYNAKLRERRLAQQNASGRSLDAAGAIETA